MQSQVHGVVDNLWGAFVPLCRTQSEPSAVYEEGPCGIQVGFQDGWHGIGGLPERRAAIFYVTA